MEIRLLNADDAGEWRRLRLEALQGDPEAFSSSVEELEALTLEDVKRRLHSGGDSFVIAAFEENRLVGVAGFHRESGPKVRHKGRIWGVYLTPSKRGVGIGRAMLEALLKRAVGIAGIEQISLSVAKTQAPAVTLYRSLGFESFGCEPRALKIGDRLIDEEYMVLGEKPCELTGSKEKRP